MRKIIHIDMDCFYAAVEMRDRPELAAKPLAVGGSSRRGVLTTCNYLARQYGVRSAMPVFKALQLCPDLVLLPVRMERYKAESRKVREVLDDYSHLVEPLSLDEAFLDVSHHDGQFASDIAREIRARIREASGGLTASAGIAPNKMLAKIASDWRKPDGQYAIPPHRIDAFMAGLPVSKLWGVGPRAAERLRHRGIETCGQMRQLPERELEAMFGRFGTQLYELCRGIDERPVQPARERKSLSTERTFGDNLESLDACRERLWPLIEELDHDVAARCLQARVRKIFVKLKFADFRVRTLERPASRVDGWLAGDLLRAGWERGRQPVRLLGVGVRLAPEGRETPRQLELPLEA